MRRWIKVALFVAIAIAVVHDAGVYLMAVYRIDDTTRSIAFEASRTAKANPASQSAWPAAATAAKAPGMRTRVASSRRPIQRPSSFTTHSRAGGFVNMSRYCGCGGRRL